MNEQIESHEVDPSRLSHGRWDHASQATIGEGDIAASYSADRIGMGRPIRRPFHWRNDLYVCVGIMTLDGTRQLEAYRIESLMAFPWPAFSYAEKTHDAEAARDDPLGFYHGVIVTVRGSEMVLCGPPVRFMPGVERQAELFAGLDRSRSR